MLYKVFPSPSDTYIADPASPLSKVQVVMATATLTKSVRALLEDMEGGGFNVEYSGEFPFLHLQSPQLLLTLLAILS